MLSQIQILGTQTDRLNLKMHTAIQFLDINYFSTKSQKAGGTFQEFHVHVCVP